MPQLEPDLPSTSPLTAVIIGSGFAGIGMAIALRKAGITDFIILEKQQDVGGVWRDNSYPGAACDVPSHLYSFSFEPNPGWTRMFAPQAEIQGYLQHCVRKYEVARHIRFGAEVQAARFDEASAQWCVTEVGGRVHRAALLISATGQLSRPALPTFEGMQAFKGQVFHSANWDHGYSLAGKRVAVIGTGASAIQFVPAIADSVAQLKVFQRSPAYILPRPDRAYSDEEKQLFARRPWRMALHRAAIYLRYEARALGFTRLKGLMKWAVGLPFRRLLNQSVGDPQLRRQLIPDYPIGCKRILLSSDYLKTLARPNVQLITEGIGRIWGWRCRAFPTSSCCMAPIPTWGTTRSSTCWKARYPMSCAAGARCTRLRPPRSKSTSRRSSVFINGYNAAWPDPCGAGARAGMSTQRATTAPTGRVSPCPIAG
ncbi:flavin-containing monooxygenase [Pseudomonas chlororaphis]|uniref:flavin-containing monooxygenase n=1 Tax=Pseudomonas chlororaphis TaxID=587753 RepID=UPI003529E373